MSESTVTSLTPAPLKPRLRGDVAAMAIVAQANVVQLQVAAHKHLQAPPPAVASPGPVRRFRESLIDWRDVKIYAETDLMLRTHEAWGQYCLFCWAFFGSDPNNPPPFAHLSREDQMRCAGEFGAKQIQVERGLQRLRHESQVRHQPELHNDPDFRESQEQTRDVPMTVFSRGIGDCSDADLLACTCQYAGMIAAIRWSADDRWTWGQSGIMELDATPEE